MRRRADDLASRGEFVLADLQARVRVRKEPGQCAAMPGRRIPDRGYVLLWITFWLAYRLGRARLRGLLEWPGRALPVHAL